MVEYKLTSFTFKTADLSLSWITYDMSIADTTVHHP